MKIHSILQKNIIARAIILVCSLCFLTGFTRVEKVRVLEGDIDQPYLKMGTLEVREKVHTFTPSGLLHGTYEMMTLGFGKTPARADKLKTKLNRQIERKARDHYGADAVIRVTYWPPLDSQSFPDGLVYARGQMVRYETFPEDTGNKTSVTNSATAAGIEASEAPNSDIPA